MAVDSREWWQDEFDQPVILNRPWDKIVGKFYCELWRRAAAEERKCSRHWVENFRIVRLADELELAAGIIIDCFERGDHSKEVKNFVEDWAVWDELDE